MLQTVLFVLGIAALIAIAVVVTFWWLMRKDIVTAFKKLLAAFVKKALVKGDVFEEETKRKLLAELEKVKKLIESFDVIKGG